MFKKLLATLLLASSFNVFAAPQIGQDFDKTAQPIATDNPSKIEVNEIFWYGLHSLLSHGPSLRSLG